MDKTIIIGGNPVVFRKTAGTMLRYKRQFGRELYPDLMRIYDLMPMLQEYAGGKDDQELTKEQKLSLAKVFLGVETEWMYDIAYIMAQQADPTITDEITWLDSFDDLNILYLFIELMPLIQMEQKASPKNV